MSTLQRTKFLSLSCVENLVTSELKDHIRARLSKTHEGNELQSAVDDEVRMQAIFNTNCVAMGTKSEAGIGVFEFYSRINHSCIPNVHNSYNSTIKQEVVHATRDILTREEILTSYITNVRNCEDRRRELRRYGFECQCAACFGPDAVSHERRRQRLSDIDQALALTSSDDWIMQMLGGSTLSDKKALKMAEENISLLVEEGLLGMDLAVGYRDCAKLSIKQNEFEIALRYARLEREVELYCLGPETEHMKGSDEFALTRIDAIEKLQCDGVSNDAAGQARKLSRNERRALARAGAKASNKPKKK